MLHTTSRSLQRIALSRQGSPSGYQIPSSPQRHMIEITCASEVTMECAVFNAEVFGVVCCGASEKGLIMKKLTNALMGMALVLALTLTSSMSDHQVRAQQSEYTSTVLEPSECSVTPRTVESV